MRPFAIVTQMCSVSNSSAWLWFLLVLGGMTPSVLGRSRGSASVTINGIWFVRMANLSFIWGIRRGSCFTG